LTKPTVKTLKKLEREEGKSSKEYHHYGFHRLARDESKHRKVLKKELKKRTQKQPRTSHSFPSHKSLMPDIEVKAIAKRI
jgi:hypothetical protein